MFFFFVFSADCDPLDRGNALLRSWSEEHYCETTWASRAEVILGVLDELGEGLRQDVFVDSLWNSANHGNHYSFSLLVRYKMTPYFEYKDPRFSAKVLKQLIERAIRERNGEVLRYLESFVPDFKTMDLRGLLLEETIGPSFTDGCAGRQEPIVELLLRQPYNTCLSSLDLELAAKVFYRNLDIILGILRSRRVQKDAYFSIIECCFVEGNEEIACWVIDELIGSNLVKVKEQLKQEVEREKAWEDEELEEEVERRFSEKPLCEVPLSNVFFEADCIRCFKLAAKIGFCRILEVFIQWDRNKELSRSAVKKFITPEVVVRSLKVAARFGCIKSAKFLVNPDKVEDSRQPSGENIFQAIVEACENNQVAFVEWAVDPDSEGLLVSQVEEVERLLHKIKVLSLSPQIRRIPQIAEIL